VVKPVKSGVEDKTKEADEAGHDANKETDLDPESGSNDDPGSSTELDSDSDFKLDFTFNQRRARFELFA
jgi:hypothetical protein